MPAKGLLARKVPKKYLPRKDERMEGWDQLLKRLTPVIAKDAEGKSDDHPFYPVVLKRHLPGVRHETVKGGRGAITGQGELKKLVFDPIFSLNHTCAMLRANLNRLFRKTWCTTKTIQGLVDHLSLYVRFHNTRLTAEIPSATDLGGS